MLFGLIHRHQYGELNDKNIQYCKICGKARYVKIKCNHKFEIISSDELFSQSSHLAKGYLIVSKCVHCGILSEDKIGVNWF